MQEIIQKNLKAKLENYWILCTDPKNLQKHSIKVWLTLFNNGNNFYERENSKRNEPHKFRLDLTDRFNLKDIKKNMALTNLSIYYTWKNIKSEYNNYKFKVSSPTLNDSFDLLDGSYSISDIQDYFELL